ncbi:MAG TPA: transposase [Candidatus Hydrogenedentes bacterium]|nr:transposase [Candidatus Hydrogenedentota bacterium]HPG65244.1 transposase [Candidatus Hydrogenedentota bacterium]
MPNYVRRRQDVGTFFFTVVTHERRPFLTEPLARECLRWAWRETRTRHPFELVAVCLLPDHLHTLWTLPEGDSDYSARWRFLKARSSWKYRRAGGVESERSMSRHGRGERGFWQRRSWEHTIRDDDDFTWHFDYIHYNPVKHGYVQWPHQWEWSTFHRYVRMGWYDVGWGDSPIQNIDDSECE